MTAGVGELHSGDDGEVPPERFERLEDRRNRVIRPRIRRRKLAAIESQPEEAENRPPRRFTRRDRSRSGYRIGMHAHRVKPGKRKRNAGAFEKRTARHRGTTVVDVHLRGSCFTRTAPAFPVTIDAFSFSAAIKNFRASSKSSTGCS